MSPLNDHYLFALSSWDNNQEAGRQCTPLRSRASKAYIMVLEIQVDLLFGSGPVAAAIVLPSLDSQLCAGCFLYRRGGQGGIVLENCSLSTETLASTQVLQVQDH